MGVSEFLHVRNNYHSQLHLLKWLEVLLLCVNVTLNLFSNLN
jgi:hypothetical protein